MKIRKKLRKRYYKTFINVFSRQGLGKYRFVRGINEFIGSYLKIIRDVQGHKMLLDQLDTLGLAKNGIYEPFETEVIKKTVNKGDVVLDIGANIGYYTLIIARIVGENGKVYAFEPEPTNFSLLKKNIEINGYKNVELIQKAVSNKTEKIKLYLSQDNYGDHRIYDSAEARLSVEVESVRLDDFFTNYNGAINFIKMDIQGAEWAAVQGMSNLLRKQKDVKIITEFWPIGLKRFGIEPIEYLKLLLNLGFVLYELNEQQKEIMPIDIHKLLEIYTPEKENYTNLLARRF